ncbi:hypothetical protein KUTeg_009536 [Tegillarca granosa]|uniref:Uncharacterized protein n=1 Tax=Tegillarca granosa TaxID=220873 RepID=A0ABQ9F967_TEGGR|nr:hypothetical protein KUTeg_009536 [Tegillarca granosa]
MDKVLQDIMTQRKQSAARRMVQGRSPRTPLGSGRGRLSPGSSPGTPPTSANRASPGATPLRPPNKDGLDMPPIKNIMKGNENPGTSAQDIESVLNNPSILEKTKGIENSGKPNQKIEKLPNNPSVKEPKTESTDNKDVPSSTEPLKEIQMHYGIADIHCCQYEALLKQIFNHKVNVSHEFVQCGKDKGSRDITLVNEKEQGTLGTNTAKHTELSNNFYGNKPSFKVLWPHNFRLGVISKNNQPNFVVI